MHYLKTKQMPRQSLALTGFKKREKAKRERSKNRSKKNKKNKSKVQNYTMILAPTTKKTRTRRNRSSCQGFTKDTCFAPGCRYVEKSAKMRQSAYCRITRNKRKSKS